MISEDVESFVIDGAWDIEVGNGAAAWVKNRGVKEDEFLAEQCSASSATIVEIRAGLLLLKWAIGRGISKLTIYTDYLVFVKGLLNPERANLCMRNGLLDSVSRQLIIEQGLP